MTQQLRGTPARPADRRDPLCPMCGDYPLDCEAVTQLVNFVHGLQLQEEGILTSKADAVVATIGEPEVGDGYLLTGAATMRAQWLERGDELDKLQDRIAELEAPQATIDLNAWLRKQSETSPAHIQKAMIDVANYLSVSGKWNVTVPYAPGTLDAVVSELAADHGKMVQVFYCEALMDGPWGVGWEEDDGGDSYFGKDLQAAARAALDAAKEASGDA